MQIKMARALDLQCVFRWHCIGKEHASPLEQNEQAFSIYKITVCIFYPRAEGDSDTRTVDCSHSCVILIAANSQRRGQVAVSNGSFLSSVCTIKFSRAHVCSQKLNVIEWQLSLNKILF